MTWPRWGKQDTLPPAIFLAVHNNSSICFGDVCFVIKITSFMSTCMTKGPRSSQFKFNNLFNKQFLWLIFFLSKVFCHAQTGEVEMDCYLKLVQ